MISIKFLRNFSSGKIEEVKKNEFPKDYVIVSN